MRWLVGVLAAGALGLASLGPSVAADTLRVCADPDNLPFSAQTGNPRGLYVDVAELVAARLGARAEYTWWHTSYGQRALRNTLLADRCDVFFGLPDDEGFMGRQLQRTAPFLEVGYAVVVAPTRPFSGLADLKSVTVAVQFRTPPQLMLATRDGFRMATFRQTEEAMDALARGEAGAAFVWGPSAGYHNKVRLGGAWRVIPVAGTGLHWPVAAGVRKGDTALKARIERALADLGPEIRRLADGYGFPLGTPVELEAGPQAPPVETAPTAPSGSLPVNPFNGRADVVPLGRSVFNQHCSHCHSPNAQSPEPSRDLRRLKRRYGDQRMAVFYRTVTEGRETKGMPRATLSPDEVWQAWTFLESIQAEP